MVRTRGGRPHVKLVIPNASCGCIIGRGGATIRNFADDSQAEIKLSSQEHMLPGVNERVLTITGASDRVLRAIALVATALSQDGCYEELISRPSTYTIDGMPMPYSGINNDFAAAVNHNVEHGRSQDGDVISVAIDVPDEHIGAVLGKGGRTISEIQITSGIRIKVSERGDYVEGTKNRRKLSLGQVIKCRWHGFFLSRSYAPALQLRSLFCKMRRSFSAGRRYNTCPRLIMCLSRNSYRAQDGRMFIKPQQRASTAFNIRCFPPCAPYLHIKQLKGKKTSHRAL